MRRFALITGGSRGLGSVLVRRFWLDGFNLVVVARGDAEVQTLLDNLPRRVGQTASSIRCDLSNADDVASLVDSVKVTVPYVDALVNNAAIQGPIGPLYQNDFSAWQRTLQVNLLAPVALCRGLIELMKRPSGAAIINLSGGGATSPRAFFSAYATSKAGLVRFSETISEELKRYGIRVNCIAPGAMNTAMLNEVFSSGAAAGERESALARDVVQNGGASMDRVADLALFLASAAGKGVSGKLISAVWDNWESWSSHIEELSETDLYTLRRITGRDRGVSWGDK